mgnify:FL=1
MAMAMVALGRDPLNQNVLSRLSGSAMAMAEAP